VGGGGKETVQERLKSTRHRERPAKCIRVKWGSEGGRRKRASEKDQKQ